MRKKKKMRTKYLVGFTFSSLRENGSGSNNWVAVNFDTISDRGSHSDERIVVDFARFDMGVRPNEHVITDFNRFILSWLDCDQILDNCLLAHLDFSLVTSKSSSVPDGWVFSNTDISNNNRVRSNEVSLIYWGWVGGKKK